MAFAKIDYFGDNDHFGGEPKWSGSITEASQLDQFDWGGGRKQPFGSVLGGRSASDMNRMIDDAIKRREKAAKRDGMLSRSTLLKDFNKEDNSTDGVSVGVTGAQDIRPNDLTFSVDRAKANSQFPIVSRIAYDKNNDQIVQFTRNEQISGMGRVVGIGSETITPIVKLNKPGFYFTLEKDEDTDELMIKNCKVFLGSLGNKIECEEDTTVEKECTGTYYAIVDFSDKEDLPKLTVELRDESESEIEQEENKFIFPLYEFEKGVWKRGNPNMIILPTYSWYGYKGP